MCATNTKFIDCDYSKCGWGCTELNEINSRIFSIKPYLSCGNNWQRNKCAILVVSLCSDFILSKGTAG